MKNKINKTLIDIWWETMLGKITPPQLLEEQKKRLPPIAGVVFSRECGFHCKHCVMPHNNSCDFPLQDLSRIDKALSVIVETGIKDIVHTGRTLKKEHISILKKYANFGLILV